jgi:hypothetical protein
MAISSEQLAAAIKAAEDVDKLTATMAADKLA